MTKLISVLALLILLDPVSLLAQAGGGMKLGPAYAAYTDSIRRSDYKWVFPILGKRLSKKGFDMQYPLGIMVNPFIGSQQVSISDLKVGFNGNPPVPINFVKFGEVKAIARSVTLRPDIWILPFLDVYGIGGAIWTQTKVQLTSPIDYKTSADFSGNIFGVGTTLAGGYHGIIGIVDLNHTWTNLDKLSGSVQGTMITPRLGYNFLFRNRPGRNLSFWFGATALFVNHGTEGTVDIGQLHGQASKSDLQAIVGGTPAWFQSLSPAQKQTIAGIAQNMLDRIDGLHPQDETIDYSLQKRPTSTWSMCAGGQFQLNHHWQFRTETGFLGGRNSLLISANYRLRK